MSGASIPAKAGLFYRACSQMPGVVQFPVWKAAAMAVYSGVDAAITLVPLSNIALSGPPFVSRRKEGER